MSNNQEQDKPNFYAVIPSYVRYDKDLEPNAKLLYGEITALANTKGHCWASNKYFADAYDVDERTVKRWLKSLKEKSYIRVEIINLNQRKIYVNSINVYEGQNLPTPRTKTSHPPDENVPPNTTYSITENTTYPDGVVSIFLDKIDIPFSLKMKISKEHSEKVIEQAVKRCLAWKDRKNDSTGILTALKQADSWNDVVSPEESKAANEKYLKSIEHMDETIVHGNKIVIGRNYVEFIRGPLVMRFEITKASFIKDVETYLEHIYGRS